MTEQGDLVAERYRLLAPIGRGGMGVVWRARDERLDRPVAVKVLLVDSGADEQAMRRAMREGRVAAKLRHPHAIMVHDVVEHDGKPCLVMEFLPAKSLAAVLAERGPLPADEIARLGAQVASALAAAHAEGIVHRDVKPANVLLADDGTAKIADFGISRAVGEATVTGAGLIAGTPAYLAPEVAAGGEASFASDVFSLGATLYAALEGRPPFGDDENPIALLRRIADGASVPPSRPGPLADVLSWLLRTEPGQRPEMATAHDALAAVAEGRSVSPPPARGATLVLPARGPRRRTVVAGAAGAALVAAGVVIGVLIGSPGEPSGEAAPSERPPVEPTAPESTAQSPTSESSLGCEARYTVTGSWPGGFQAEVTVRNTGAGSLTGWTVSWELSEGQTVTDAWNGELAREGSAVTVRNADWNAVVSEGGSVAFGFNGGTESAEVVRPSVSCSGD
ncbi:protein kinase domain-containing protein [Prauserella cavernicola]|uniref:non-specific serine/threonine protein kinase n=1 Tax=Prauserella cavernicola TaxID=2800127 RepID=A0A934QTG6_9PSEU|nr:protein kinase [Prauserella cavernicola]MBK1785941.1 protein kinase [Prauserella cavernicola]